MREVEEKVSSVMLVDMSILLDVEKIISITACVEFLWI